MDFSAVGVARATGGKDSNPLRDQALTSGSYGTAKVDELEKNGSSIVENDSFSRGERFSAIRGSVIRPAGTPTKRFGTHANRSSTAHHFPLSYTACQQLGAEM